MANQVYALLGLKHNLDILNSFLTLLAPFAIEQSSIEENKTKNKTRYLSVLQQFMSDQRFEQISKVLGMFYKI